VHPTPLDLIVADTQGSIGFMLQQTLNNEFHKRKIDRQCITIITQVLVDADDPAFQPDQANRQLYGGEPGA
jgi:carbamate kinase